MTSWAMLPLTVAQVQVVSISAAWISEIFLEIFSGIFLAAAAAEARAMAL